MGLLRGEWYMATSLLKPPEVRGKNLLPFEYTILNETDICFTLPWAELIERAVAAGADLDEVEARNSPPQYQVSVWHDTAFIDEDDFSDEGGSPINLSDFLPNAGGNCNAAGEFNDNDSCFHNSAGPYGDLNVDALDVTDFLAEFGRSVFSRPCPNCKN
jgi:hypothetical protein